MNVRTGNGLKTSGGRSRLDQPKKDAYRYPENVTGPFYVEQDLCLICKAPEHEAPDLMGFFDGAEVAIATSKNNHQRPKRLTVQPMQCVLPAVVPCDMAAMIRD